MATIAKIIPRPQATPNSLKQEINDYLTRAENLERHREFDEASVLYRRVISLIQSHEGTQAIDKELSAMKRDANQRLLDSSLVKNRTDESNGRYRAMVGQLERRLSQPDDFSDDGYAPVFEDPAAFQPVREKNQADSSNSVLLFQLDQGAKLFYLAKDGAIQTTSDTLPLSLFQITEDGVVCGLLKLGSWIYPLHPKVSPAFKTGYDGYIFPNNTSVGEFVGLMFDDSVAPAERQFFEEILADYSVFMAQPGTQTFGQTLTAQKSANDDVIGTSTASALDEASVPYDTKTPTGKLAAALITGTKFLTTQLATGVAKAETLIGQTSKNIQEKIVPNPEPVKVNRGLHVTARGLRTTSGVAVKASGYVVSKVGALTVGLARMIAPNFGKVETKVKPDGTVEVVKLSGIRSIGHAGLTSYAIIYESCENAAKHLATNLANESIRVVKYKYGDDASVLTENAAFAVGNSLLTAHYVSGLGPKAIARKVVKDTAKQTAKNAFK